jgi:hypothetical protein
MNLTNEIERGAFDYIRKIDEMGNGAGCGVRFYRTGDSGFGLSFPEGCGIRGSGDRRLTAFKQNG